MQIWNTKLMELGLSTNQIVLHMSNIPEKQAKTQIEQYKELKEIAQQIQKEQAIKSKPSIDVQIGTDEAQSEMGGHSK